MAQCTGSTVSSSILIRNAKIGHGLLITLVQYYRNLEIKIREGNILKKFCLVSVYPILKDTYAVEFLSISFGQEGTFYEMDIIGSYLKNLCYWKKPFK